MVKNFFPLAFLFAFAMYSCQQNTVSESSQDLSHLDYNLFSPIQCDLDSTEIYLMDFIPNAELIDSVSFNNKRIAIADQKILIPQASAAIDQLFLHVKGNVLCIPVLQSKKQRIRKALRDEGYQKVALAGSFNGWNPKATPMSIDKDGAWSTELILQPGEYAYQVVIDGDWKLDPENPNSKSNGMGGMNSVLTVGETTNSPFITSKLENNQIVIEADQPCSFVTCWQNMPLTLSQEIAEAIVLEIPTEASEIERSHLSVRAFNENGIANDILIPLAKANPILNTAELSREDHQSKIIYFTMIDRFKNGNTANDAPVKNDSILPIANHLGGDMTGIKKALDDGYFETLGVNTLWLSPITQNPQGAWGLWDKGVTSKFSGYHGYWPVTSTSIDSRLGSDSSFKALINGLHEKDMSILVDYVANHVHQEHVVYQNNPDWATPLYLPDGTMNTERWDEYRLTTWFDTFLPTLDFSKPEVIECMTDSAVFWFENYQIDGFRHDATKHIPEEFWRTLTYKLRTRIADRDVYQIGETYGSPELIGSYVNNGQLNAQFDFNLYDAMVSAFAKDNGDLKNLQRVLEESLEYYGSHHVMGNITGNQDRARFTSYADGGVRFDEDPKLAGWTREIKHQGQIGYDRMQLLHAFLMTIPGIPCVYYGDEIAMAGGNDPDNRRMMRFDDLNASEQETLDLMSNLAKLRSNEMCLLYGDTKVKQADQDYFEFTRSYLGEELTICLYTGYASAENRAPNSENALILASNNWDSASGQFSGPGYFISK